MASTPVKTSQVDRSGMGFAGVPAGTDATTLKGRAAPESVRYFESLLEATNRTAQAEKPVPKAASRTPAPRANAQQDSRADARDTAREPTTPKYKPAANAHGEAEGSRRAEQAANIAETEAAPKPDEPSAAAASAPLTEVSDTEATEDTDESAPADSAADASVVIATLLSTPLLPVETLIASQAALAPQTGSVQVVPVDVDLSQQDPVILPQALMDDALAAATVPTVSSDPAKAATAAGQTPLPANPQTATPAQPTTPAANAIIEALTVATPKADAQAAAQAEAETAPAQQATDATTAQSAQPSAEAQTAAMAPVVVDAQSKAKPATATSQADTATQQDADTLAALPTADIAPAPDADAGQDQSRQDQSPADRGRERAQERSQAGERLAARFADSQISLIRDEASLSGPMQAFKAALGKAAAAEALTSAAASPIDAPKHTAPSAATAAVFNAAGATEGSSAAAKTAARPNAPVYQTPIIQQVGTRLVETAANGGGRVIMDLRPEHLGRVRIDVDVRDDGRVTATVLVDNPEALEQLRRDAGQLEQALRDAGLNPEQNSLNFGLREQAQENNRFGREGRQGRGNGRDEGDAVAEPEIAPQIKQSVVPGLGVIDIRI
jgi:flagellar hook-length control protein FliK